MIYLLIGAILYLTISTVILLRNILDFTSIYQNNRPSTTIKKISFCIPARNEELSIKSCVESVLKLDYPDFEVLVLDDDSADATPRILNEIKLNDTSGRLKILRGEAKPDEWLGKNWACHLLSKYAIGDILVFLDADTWVNKNLGHAINSKFVFEKTDALTIWPEQKLETFWEKVVIPHIYYVLFTLLPVKYTHSDPIWMPSIFQSKFRSYFAAACGQFIAFTRNCYHEIGGHAAVFNKVVEDVELARLIRRNNRNIKMYLGDNAVFCRMYSNQLEIFYGFRKNFLAGFANNLFIFIASAILHFIVFILPFFTLFIGIYFNNHIITIISIVLIIWPWVLRFYIDKVNKWDLKYGVFHQLGVIWFQVLSIVVLIDRIFNRKVSWKGRKLS